MKVKTEKLGATALPASPTRREEIASPHRKVLHSIALP